MNLAYMIAVTGQEKAKELNNTYFIHNTELDKKIRIYCSEMKNISIKLLSQVNIH